MAMRYALAMVAVALLLVCLQPALAADETHEGTVVKVEKGKLTMKAKGDAKEHSHDVGADAKVTCDGKACKLEDLKAGFTVKVTMKDKKTVTAIDATSTK